jgi:hypothetical protein
MSVDKDYVEGLQLHIANSSFEDELEKEFGNISIEDLEFKVVDIEGTWVIQYTDQNIQTMWKWFKRGCDA